MFSGGGVGGGGYKKRLVALNVLKIYTGYNQRLQFYDDMADT